MLETLAAEESTSVGICAALLEAKTSGEGQVVDAAMTEGAALNGLIYGMHASGHWSDQREDNVLDGGSITTGFMRLRRKVRFITDRGKVSRRITRTHRPTGA